MSDADVRQFENSITFYAVEFSLIESLVVYVRHLKTVKITFTIFTKATVVFRNQYRVNDKIERLRVM